MPTRMTYGMLSFHRGCVPLLFLHGGVAVNPRRFKEPRTVEKPIEKSVGNPTSYSVSAWDDTWIAVVHAELMSQYANFQSTYQSLFNPVRTKGALENHSYPIENSNNSLMELDNTKEKQTELKAPKTGLKKAVGDCCGGDAGDCCIGNHGVTNGAGVTGVSTDARGASMRATDTKGAHMEVDDEFEKGIGPDHHMSIKSGDATGLDPDHHKVDMSNNAGGEDEFDRGIGRSGISTSVAVNRAQHTGVNQKGSEITMSESQTEETRFLTDELEKFQKTLVETKEKCYDEYHHYDDFTGQSCLTASENTAFNLARCRVQPAVAFVREKLQGSLFVQTGLAVLIGSIFDELVKQSILLGKRRKEQRLGTRQGIKLARLVEIEEAYVKDIFESTETKLKNSGESFAKFVSYSFDQYDTEVEKFKSSIDSARKKYAGKRTETDASICEKIQSQEKKNHEKYEEQLHRLGPLYAEWDVKGLPKKIIQKVKNAATAKELTPGEWILESSMEDHKEKNAATATELTSDESWVEWRIEAYLSWTERNRRRLVEKKLKERQQADDEFKNEIEKLKQQLHSKLTELEDTIGEELQKINDDAKFLLKRAAFADLEQQEIIAENMTWEKWYKKYTKALKEDKHETCDFIERQIAVGIVVVVILGFGIVCNNQAAKDTPNDEDLEKTVSLKMLVQISPVIAICAACFMIVCAVLYLLQFSTFSWLQFLTFYSRHELAERNEWCKNISELCLILVPVVMLIILVVGFPFELYGENGIISTRTAKGNSCMWSTIIAVIGLNSLIPSRLPNGKQDKKDDQTEVEV